MTRACESTPFQIGSPLMDYAEIIRPKTLPNWGFKFSGYLKRRETNAFVKSIFQSQLLSVTTFTYDEIHGSWNLSGEAER